MIKLFQNLQSTQKLHDLQALCLYLQLKVLENKKNNLRQFASILGSLKAAASTSLSSEEMDRLAPPANMIEKSGSLEIIPENCSLDPSGRLSISLDDKNVSSPDSCGSPNQPCRHTQTLSMPPSASRGHHGDIKSYSCLPQVRY